MKAVWIMPGLMLAACAASPAPPATAPTPVSAEPEPAPPPKQYNAREIEQARALIERAQQLLHDPAQKGDEP